MVSEDGHRRREDVFLALTGFYSGGKQARNFISFDGMIQFRDNPTLTRATAVILLVGAALTMAVVAIGGGSVDSCGGGCDEILSSKWSRWLGVVPLLWIGAATYTVLAILTWRNPRSIVSRAIAGVVLGAAVYLTSVQVLVFHSLCVACSTAHGLASIAAFMLLRRAEWKVSLIAAPAAAVILAFGAPQKSSDQTSSSATENSTAGLFQISQAGMLSVLDGAINLDTRWLPRWGSSDAKQQAFVVMNFACGRCAKLHEHLEKILKNHCGQDVAVYFVPVATSPQHAEAQAFLLTVWRSDPDTFARLGQMLLRGELELEVGKLATASGLDPADDQLAEARDAMVKHGQLVNLTAEKKGIRGFPQLWFTDGIEANVWRSSDALRAALNRHLGMELPAAAASPVPAMLAMPAAEGVPVVPRPVPSLAVTPRRVVLPAGPLTNPEDYTIQMRSLNGGRMPAPKVQLPEAWKTAGLTFTTAGEPANHVIEVVLHFPTGFDTTRHLGSEMRLESDTESFAIPLQIRGARPSAATAGRWSSITSPVRP